MKDRFKEFLEDLNYNELLDLQKSVKDKDSDIRKVLDNHVDVVERMNARVCATCGNQLLPNNTKNLVLHFGPEDFKKKASFCAFDCLEFFVEQLKAMENKKEKDKKIYGRYTK